MRSLNSSEPVSCDGFRPFSGMALAQGYRPFFPRCTGGVRPAEPYPSFQSVIITMNVQNGSSVESCSGQQVPEFADLMHEVLSDWITGKTDTDETGIRCGQLIRQAMDGTAMQDNLSCPDSVTHIGSETGGNSRAVEISQAAQECIALAALQRALRKSRFDDVSGAMDYFHLELYGDWSGLLATANELSGLLFDEAGKSCRA